MRWAVELPAASGGTGPTVTVDAESWKNALSEARAGKPLTKFRVDFDEDNSVRVHDLVTNERFTLKPASATVGAAPTATPIVAPAEPATPVAAASLAPPTAPQTVAASATAPSQTPVAAPQSTVPPPRGASIVPPPGPSGRPSVGAMQAVVPLPPGAKPVGSVPPPSAVSSASLQAQTPPTTTPASSAPSAPAAPPSPPASLTPAAPIAPPRSDEPTAELNVPQPGSLFFSRDREAAASNGLTYRERLVAVPPGTSVEVCTHVARAVLEQLRAALSAAPAGKFVSIAVFDHVFKSRPERPPIIVLGWKDWRGDEPEITVSRPSATSLPAITASIPPNSFAPPPMATQPPPAAAIEVVELAPRAPSHPAMPAVVAPAPPAATPEPPPSVSIAPPPKHTVSFHEMPAAVAAALAQAPQPAPTASAPPPAVPEAPFVAQPVATPVPPPVVAPVATPVAQPIAAPAVVPSVVVESSPLAAATVTSIDTQLLAQSTSAPPAEASTPALLSQPVAPVPLVAPAATAIPLVQHTPNVPSIEVSPEIASPSQPAFVAPVAQPSAPPPAQPSSPPPAQPNAWSAPVSTPAPPVSRPTPPPPTNRRPSRIRGDELLSEAFEALSDMAFLNDAAQATDFAAQVAKDLLHTPFVAVSLYDIDRDELVVDWCEKAQAAKGRRAKIAKGETRSDVARRNSPALLATWEPDALVQEAPLGPALFVPVAVDRRLFGVLELHREVGEHPFGEDEEGTASYIAEQLAKFLLDHSKRVGFQDDKRRS